MAPLDAAHEIPGKPPNVGRAARRRREEQAGYAKAGTTAFDHLETEKAAATPRPSTIGSTADKSGRQAVRAGSYTLRTKARKLVQDLAPSVAACELSPIPISAGGTGFGNLLLRHGEARATMAGLARCSSPWACPICAPRVSSLRAEAVRPQVERLMARGDTAHLLTLTMQHSRRDTLADLFALFLQVWRALQKTAEWKAIQRAGKPEYVRGFDVTHSRRHGWHLHLHLSLFLPEQHADPAAATVRLLAAWMATVAEAGGLALPGAQDARRVDDPAKAAAYAVTPAACYEALAMAMKRHRAREGGREPGRTPFEILEGAVAGNRQDVALWREYVGASVRKRQVTSSRGLKLGGDEDLMQEAEAAEAKVSPPPDALAHLDRRAMREADRRGLIPRALDAAEAHAGDRQAAEVAITAVLSELREGEWRILPPVMDPSRRCPPD